MLPELSAVLEGKIKGEQLLLIVQLYIYSELAVSVVQRFFEPKEAVIHKEKKIPLN